MEQQKIDTQTPQMCCEILAKTDPLGDGISHVELIRVSGSDLDVVNAARVSYGKVAHEITPRDENLINYLVEHDHTSPFEHNQLSFRIKAPIFVIRQWMRHRMNSYNEISYRYVKSALEFYVPTVWRDQDHKNRQGSVGGAQNPEYTEKFKDTLLKITQTYEELLSLDVCREQARGILPLCTYSEFIFTTNLHSLMHFIRLRTHPGAQLEIRVYAQAMLEMAEKYFPASIKAFRKKHMTE
ncbi:MAG: FAD-dependent thymidylate synthase [Candidatus Babeliaceae bacterium]|nr:FAD-dependent thymidylate synthase [Candidatus Babeliaceae bacterium]